MAETMTYDAATDTVTTEDNLNEAEQEALQVGEAMQEEQEQLLAGKYKNAEDLEKAYVELQRKLGEENTEASETTGESEDNPTSEETSEETTETKEDSPALALVNEAAAEYWDNNQTLSEDTIAKLGEMNGSDLLAAYLEAQKANPLDQAPAETADLTQQDIDAVRSVAGGDKQYGELVQWAADNLERSDVQAFDELISSGNVGAIKLAVSGLKAQYESVNGYEGTMLTGKPPATSKDVFRSQAEVVQAMSDPRYEKDPAYRQDLVEKLDRSNVKF
tara:strand:- start:527 stop:1354 length:828 start_codon:yes stop_codon:yes gene_type:complete